MFHIYFGAFDFVLYTAAFIFALCLSEAICDELDAGFQPAAAATMPTTEMAKFTQPKRKKKSVETQSVKHLRTDVRSAASEGKTALSQAIEPTVKKKEKTTQRPILNLANIKLYQLRKQSVIKICDLPSVFELPKTIKQYRLRGEPVIHLQALKTYVEVTT